MKRTIEMEFVYQPMIDGPPQSLQTLHQQSVANDEVTVNTWKDQWLSQYKAATERFGDFSKMAAGLLYGQNLHKPCVVIGSGPSLKNAIPALQENAKSAHPVMTVSCLHNFGYFEDNDCHADYYFSMDAGQIVVSDVYEGREKEPEHYWAATEKKTLICYPGSHPDLFDKWRGKIYFVNFLQVNVELQRQMEEIQQFDQYVSCGGTALGGAMYFAKVFLGSSEIIYVGADFCFDYDHTFHAYPTQYDSYQGNGMGHVIRHPDVYGNLRSTWPSYFGFKCWFDRIACEVPGSWVSASEGLLGAYREGNIRQFKYMPLESALYPYTNATRVFLTTNQNKDGKELTREPMLVKDWLGNTKSGILATLF